jgi:phosphate:Na+ symporter
LATLINILGSVALLLWGLRMVRTGVMRSYGPVLKRWARRAEGKLIAPFISGLLVAVALQSSTATAMIAASFSAQNVMATATAFLIMLGADVGTALAVLVASQKITELVPILLIIGVSGFLSNQSSKVRGISRAFIGLGLILLSLSLIAGSAKVLTGHAEFVAILDILSSHAGLFVMIGLMMTYLAHSSLAIVLLTVGLVAAGSFDVEAGIYLVLGANIGSGLLPVVANWQSSKNARIPVTANLMIRAIGVLITYFCVELLIEQLSRYIPTNMIPIGVHIVLNVAVAFVGLLTARIFLASADRILPDDQVDSAQIGPKYLDENLLSSTGEALACAKREALFMADKTQEMLRGVNLVLKYDSDEKRKAISEMDDDVDRLYDAIKLYAAEILQKELTEDETKRAMDLLSFTANMEHIGDIIDTGLMGLAAKKIKQHSQFSKEGWAEIEELLEAVSNNFELAINTFISDDADLARQLVQTKPVVSELERNSIETHFQRLGSGHTDTLTTSSLHLDVLRDLKRINSHLTSVAYPVLLAAGEAPQTKWRRAEG